MTCVNIFLHLVVYVIHYLLTCCTESERSAEYGKTCLVFSNYIDSALDFLSIILAYFNNNIIFEYIL